MSYDTERKREEAAQRRLHDATDKAIHDGQGDAHPEHPDGKNNAAMRDFERSK